MYNPEPHFLLSMEEPRFLIGLRHTAKRGNSQSQIEWEQSAQTDIQTVKTWLEGALCSGIGSRVSSGYGRAIPDSSKGEGAASQFSKTYRFKLWTQGIYGSEPPSSQNGRQGKPEFRPTAVRGIVRYWFRAIALSLYDSEMPNDSGNVCQALEETLFGALGKQGKIALNVSFNSSKRTEAPYFYDGQIDLEASEQQYLDLAHHLLILATHLGGVGRGSRRPLHLLDIGGGQRQMRGCHWCIEGEGWPLEYDPGQWRRMFDGVAQAMQQIQPSSRSYAKSPGFPGQRRQDVLDRNAQVWLIKSDDQIAPDQVTDWRRQGYKDEVRGNGLKLFYGSSSFKGQNRDGIGNPNVGGAFKPPTPSFVWIKSIFPKQGLPYQAITIFGSDNSERRLLSDELTRHEQRQEALLVYGQTQNQHSNSIRQPRYSVSQPDTVQSV